MGRALVRDPLLFLFDEPLSNLDAKLRVEMRTEIKKLHQKVGKTTVYVTHDQVEAMTLASRIAVMHQGRVQQFAEPREVYDRPANMFVAGFMGSPAMNFIPAEMVERRRQAGAVGQDRQRHSRPRLPLHGEAGARVRRRPRDPRHPARASQPRRSAGGQPEAGHGVRVRRRWRWSSRPAPRRSPCMRLGDREIVGRFDPDEAPRMGEEIRLGVDMAKACLFDPATQTPDLSERLIHDRFRNATPAWRAASCS